MIYTFVSHKGGVGRTMTLVHTGLLLASKVREAGLRVLLIDMDLDAPGFQPYFPELDLKSSKGFADLILNYQDPKKAYNTREEWLRKALTSKKSKHIVNVSGAKNLSILPAGVKVLPKKSHEVNEAIGSAISSTSRVWPAKKGFFGDLRNILNKEWDYILVDSRAGLAEMTYASAIVLADVLVPCFRLNNGNLEGIKEIYYTFLTRQKDIEPEVNRGCVVPIATPVPPSTSKELQGWLKMAATIFFPDLEKEIESGKETKNIEKLSPAQRMFQLFIHRVHRDEAGVLGEWRYLKDNGDLQESIDRGSSIYKSIVDLTNHLRRINADKDAQAARSVELFYYNELKDHKIALKFWKKRFEFDPFALSIWEDLESGYVDPDRPAIEAIARNYLEEIISQRREKIRKGAWPNDKITLAQALLHHCIFHGKSMHDAGLSLIDEAIDLVPKDIEFQDRARHIAGQVVMELAKTGVQKEITDSHGRAVDMNLAIEHFRHVIQYAKSYKSTVGSTYFLLAEALEHVSRHGESVRQLDFYIKEITKMRETEKTKSELVKTINEQSDCLEYLGHYDWSLRNTLRIGELTETAEVSRESISLLRKCGLHDLADQKFRKHEQLFPNDKIIYLLESFRLTLLKRFDYSRQLLEIAQNRLGKTKAYLMTNGAIKFIEGDLKSSYEAFLKVAKENFGIYEMSMAFIVSILAGKKKSMTLLPPTNEEDFRDLALVAFAQDDESGVSTWTNNWSKLKISNPLRCELGIIFAMSRALQNSKDSESHLRMLSEYFRNLPMLKFNFQTNFEFAVLEKVWEFRKKSVPSNNHTIAMDRFLAGIHKAKPWKESRFKARNEKRSLRPKMAYIPDIEELQ